MAVHAHQVRELSEILRVSTAVYVYVSEGMHRCDVVLHVCGIISCRGQVSVTLQFGSGELNDSGKDECASCERMEKQH